MCHFTECNAGKIDQKVMRLTLMMNTCLKIKKKNKKLKKTETVTVSCNNWKESNGGLSENELEEKRGNKRVKGSADLQQAIYNAKRDHTKMNLIDNGYKGKCLN